METVNQVLLDGIREDYVKQVVIGINWTLVEGQHGCGLAQTPQRDTPGCQPVPSAGQLTSMHLTQLAQYINSDNPMEVAIGMAAVNASYNRYDIAPEWGNGLDIFRNVAENIAVVGRFPRLTERYKKLKIIEQEPIEGEYPTTRAEEILKSSRYSIITASTFVNGTAENLISFAKNSQMILVGPGTPFCSNLFGLGINILSGLIINDPKKASEIVAQGGATQSLKKVGRYAFIRSH